MLNFESDTLDEERLALRAELAVKRQAVKMARTDQTYTLAAAVFRAVSIPLRLKILDCLCTGEKNVSELLEQLDACQSNVSHHLNLLHRAGFLGRRQDGTRVFYYILNPQLVSLLRHCAA